MTQHTPGPWNVTELPACPTPGYTYQVGGDGIRAHVALTVMPSDARLIAAAPDLLAACQAIADLANGQARANLMMVTGQARQAIAKATGE